MIHPIQWPDIIIGVILAEGFIHVLRSTLHFVSRKRSNQQVVERVEAMRPRALDSYRYAAKDEGHAPLG